MVMWTPWLRQPTAAHPILEPSAPVRWLAERLASGEARFVASPDSVGFGRSPMLFGLPDARGTAALPLRRLQAYASATNVSANTGVHQMLRELRSPLLDLAAARYIVFGQVDADNLPAIPRLDPALSLAFDRDGVAIFENHATLPRARIVHRVIAVADEARALERMQEFANQKTHAADLGLGDEVVLAPDGDGRSAAAVEMPPPDSSEWVRIVDVSDPDAVVLDAQLVSPGFVVLADAYHPRWRATLDGSPASIHPADLLFRAVQVPPGRHRIEFHYRPRADPLGWWTALAAGGVCVLLARRRA